MSYRMIQKSEDRIDFVPERKDTLITLLALVLGLGALVSGLYDLYKNIFQYWTLIISGAGLSFVAGAFLLMQFHRNRPARMSLDARGGFVSLLNRGGDHTRIPVSELRESAYRFAGRGQYMAFLIRYDGGAIDLFARRSIRKLQERLHRIASVLERARNDESYTSELPDSIKEHAWDGGGRLYLWKERVTFLNAFLITLFFAGMILALIGGLRQAGVPVYFEYGLALAFVLFAIYAFASMIHSLFVQNWIYMDDNRFAWGRSRPQLEQIRKTAIAADYKNSKDRDQVYLLEYSMDLNSGFSEFHVLDEQQYRSLMDWRRGQSPRDFRARRFFGSLPTISLFGLTTAKVIRFQRVLNWQLRGGELPE